MKKLKLEKFNDRRFKIIKYLDILKKFLLTSQKFRLMILNNIAQKLYLNHKLNIMILLNFIMTNLKKIKF